MTNDQRERSAPSRGGWAVTLLLAAVSVTGCRTTYQADVARGPAVSPPTPAVVMFPVPCHSSNDKCEDAYGDAIKGKIANELEFAGFRIIDGEKLVREARTREDDSSSLSLFRTKVMTATSRRQVGAIFDDLPPAARRELLAEAGADGIVTASINMIARGSSDNWVVEVQIRYALAPDFQTVWVTRCKHESYWNERDSWSIEQAATCALKGGLQR